MVNPIAPYDQSLLSLPHLEMANTIIGVANAIAIHPGYQDAFPPTIPNAKELLETGNHYSALITAVSMGDRGKIAERDAFRIKAVQQLMITLIWTGMRALREDNPSLTMNIGVPPKKNALSRSAAHVTTGTPKGIQIRHGAESGSVIIDLPKVNGAVIYKAQACQGDPSKEESWSQEWPSTKCKGITVSGLEPGEIYYFRMRCFGRAGNGPWSAIISLMVI